MRLARVDTVQAIVEARKQAGSLTVLSNKLGISKATLSGMLNGRGVSRETEDRVRMLLGRPVYVRKQRYSVPTDPRLAAKYLVERMSRSDIDLLIHQLICENGKRQSDL